MVVSNRHRFAFISTLKCATNSLTHLLITRYEGHMPGGFHERRMDLVPDGYFTFSVCRNPFSRAVSVWWSTCMRNDRDRYGFRQACPDPNSLEGFMTWLARGPGMVHDLLTTQSEWHRNTRIDRFLKIEKLDEEFAQLPFVRTAEGIGRLNATITEAQSVFDLQGLKSGKAEAEVSTVPQAPRSEAKTYLSSRAAELILHWASEDFERFGYSRDPSDVSDAADGG